MALEALFQLRPEGLAVVIGGMGSLSAIVALALLRQVTELAAEQRRLEQLRMLTLAPLESDDDARDVSVFDALLTQIPKLSLVRRATEAVLAVRAQQSPTREPILGILIGGDALRLGWVRAAPNLFMLLGLFGTVLGLAGSIGSLGPQVAKAATAVNPGQLSSALGLTLGQMQDAFGCSLWGIILSFVCGGLLTVVTAKRGRFTAQIERYALTELAPAVLPRSSEEFFERQQKLIRGTANTFRQFDATMNETIGKFDKLTATTGASVEKTLEQLGLVAAQMNSSLERITAGVHELGQQLKGSADTLANAQLEGASSLALAQQSAAQAFQNAEATLGLQLGGQVKMVEEVQQNFAQHSNQILGSVSATSERLDKTVATILEGSGVARQETQNLVGQLSTHFERLERVLGEQVEHNQRVASVSIEGIHELSQRLLTSADALLRAQAAAAVSLGGTRGAVDPDQSLNSHSNTVVALEQPGD